MKTIQFMVLLFGLLTAKAQVIAEDPVYYNSNLPADVRQKNENVSFEPGIRMPLGMLAAIMGPAPELGVWVRGKIHERNYLDIGGSAFAPDEVNPFSYSARNSTYLVRPKGVGGMAGFRLAKVFTLSERKYKTNVEWLSTFGYAFLMYEDKYSTADAYGNVNSHADLKALQTFHIGQGVRFTIDNFGLLVNYNYTPYGQFSSHVASGFGAHSFSANVVYKI